jgi:outer membrane protein assembly factor BamD (BamD/ComL family)
VLTAAHRSIPGHRAQHHDLQDATDYFVRLRREHPASPWARYAAGWSEALARLSRAEQEAARIGRELGSLRQ